MILQRKPMGRAPSAREAFTLLEVVLAISIGMVLLYGLYRVMELQVAQSQVGRELVEQGTVARGIFTRMSGDILSSIRPVDPREAIESTTSSSETGTDSSSTTGGTTSSTGGTTGTTGTPTTGTTTTDTTGGTTSTTTPSTTTGTSTTTALTEPFNIGVAGGPDYLILTIGRVPRELSIYQADPEKAQVVSDLRRVMYWLGSGNKGLARYHSTRVTAADLATGPEAVPEGEIQYLAPEVAALTFEYFDGGGWVESWDSSFAEDGTTPQGPPAAIRITVSLRRGEADADGQAATDQFTHVVLLPTANNLIPATTSP